ncbi:Sodium channel [Trichinella spiralis]|uniref:Sodium channel n=1 Tax=Trichinella spiralis TaxID=6334 RepID=A0ABR3KHG8_TRISP
MKALFNIKKAVMLCFGFHLLLFPFTYACNFCCKLVLNGFVGQYHFRPMVNFTDEQLSTLLTSANQNSSSCHICNG